VDHTRTVPSLEDDARRGAGALLRGVCYCHVGNEESGWGDLHVDRLPG